MIDWLKVWFGALTRPTPAGYAALFGELTFSAAQLRSLRMTALAWLVTGGVAAAILSMVTYSAPIQIAALATLCALPVFALIYVAVTVLTARSALWLARQMTRGDARTLLENQPAMFDRLLYTLAAINAPMSILSALVYLLPYGALLAYALGLYWVYLTALAVKTVVGLSWGQAVAASALFILFSLLVLLLGVGVALLPGETV